MLVTRANNTLGQGILACPVCPVISISYPFLIPDHVGKMTSAILQLHAFSTIFMTGIIWFVQVVHYPLNAKVGEGHFTTFHKAHTSRTGLVVAAPMMIELVCSVLLVISPPKAIAVELALLGLVLVVLIWITTVAFSMPCHGRLSKGFDAGVLRKLILTNWLRTALWRARSLLALYFLNSYNLS